MKHLAHISFLSLLLSFTPTIAQTSPGETEHSSATGDNPTPAPCCNCISMEINKQHQMPGEKQATPEPDKQGNVSVEVIVRHTGATDCPQSVKFTVSANGTDAPAALPDQNGTVAAGESVTLTFVITPDESRMCEDWEFTLTCENGSIYCDRQEITVGCVETCTSCDGDTAEPSASQPGGPSGDSSGSGAQSSSASGSVPVLGGNPPSNFLGYDITFSAIIPTTKSFGGMTSGSLRFEARDFTFPGRRGLIGNVSPDFAVTSLTDILSKVETKAGAAAVVITDGPAQNGFTVTHRDPAGSDFRTTVISWLNEGGLQRLRMDSTYDGTTMRHEQTQPQPGTLVLQKGRVIADGSFVPLHTESLTKTSTPGIRVYRRKVKERASGSHPWVIISDTVTTWERQIFGWMKTQEITDPEGAALTSTWVYYQPGDFSGPGAGIVDDSPTLHRAVGRLKHHIRYDGYEEFHTYSLFSHSVTTPYARDVAGKTTVSTWDPGSKMNSITTRVGGTILSKTVRTHSPGGMTVDKYTSENEKLTTLHTYRAVNQDFGGKPEKTFHPDGTLTTYSYQRDTLLGGYTTIIEHGARDLQNNGTTVIKGTRTTTTRNSRGTVILSKTTAIGHGTGSDVFSSMAVTGVDNLGRALVTAHHAPAPVAVGEAATADDAAYITSTSYSCCGISSVTDMYGVKTFHAYDGLRRRIKTNTLGVTIETVHTGTPAADVLPGQNGENPDGSVCNVFTEIHRYPEEASNGISSTLVDNNANRISESRRNLSGTRRESHSPDPTALDEEGKPKPGALAATISTTTFKPASGISTRTVTETPDGFEQATDSFLDGRTHKTTGVLSPQMEYGYTVNPTGELTTRSYLDDANPRETTATQSDRAGRTLRISYMDGAFATMTYNTAGQLTKSTDPDGVTTLYGYNSRGERTVTALDLPEDEDTPPNGAITYGTDTIQFSETDPASGTINGVTGPVWKTTSKVWYKDESNQVVEATVSTALRSRNGLSSSTESIGVDNTSTSLTTLSGNGNWTTTRTNPDNTTDTETYAAGLLQVSENKDSNGAAVFSIAYDYDPLNRPFSQFDSRLAPSLVPTDVPEFSYSRTTTSYLSATADFIESITVPRVGSTAARTTYFTYDIRGRRINVNAPDSLDANGNNLTNVTNTAYNPDGTVLETSGAQTYRTTHTYDYAQRMVGMTTYGTETATTTWKYSEDRGFLTEKIHPGEINDETASADYGYTAAGRLRTRTWERGVTTTYGYDKGGRRTSTDYSDTTPDVSITYDALNRPDEVTSGTATWDYEYDPVTLRLLSETHPLGGTSTERVLTRSYDSLSRPDGFALGIPADPDLDHSVSYGFDDAGRYNNVTGAGKSFDYTYTAGDLIDTVTGPEHTVTNTWDIPRRTLYSKNNEVDSATVSQYTYGVNNIGQRETVQTTGSAFGNTNRGWAWGYDSLGQATKAVNAADTAMNRAYAFDGIGNRTSATNGTGGSATTVGYTPNDLNQYETINPGTAVNPTYDADGNLRNDAGINALTYGLKYEWDAENRLIAVSKADDTLIATYTYDYMSRRIRKTTTAAAYPYQSASDTAYLYDGWNVVAEYSISGGSTVALVQAYTWGLDLSGSMQGAGGVGGLLSIHRGPEIDENDNRTWSDTFYPTYDGNGNVSEYLDKDGDEAAHFEYDPFGRLVSTTGTPAVFTYRFSTKPQDFETGLYYYGYRYYDPQTGRWPSRDPIEEQGGINLYGFLGNDGVNDWDFLGLQEVVGGALGDESLSYTWTQPRADGTDFTPNGESNFEISFSASKEKCEMTVTIKINFVNRAIPEGFYKNRPGYRRATQAEIDAAIIKFQAGIDQKWGGHQICCDSLSGRKNLIGNRVTLDKKYCCCDLKFLIKNDPSGTKVGVFHLPEAIANQHNWNISNPKFTPEETGGHEIGHFLGNVDEYLGSSNPVSNGKPYGPPIPEKPDPASIMNNPKANALEKHFHRIMATLEKSSNAENCKLNMKK
jgi:RHS repeat-associated protein